jgi:undecaprenyl diphosphate synthase
MDKNLLDNVPKHVAIIMDGNRRWAKKMLLPAKVGHQSGAKNAKNIALECKKLGVEFLTLYTFSSENWHRSDEEVRNLMELLKEYLATSTTELIEQDVRIKFIGRKIFLDQELKDMMERIEEESCDNSFTLCLALSYGSRDEIRDAAMQFAAHCKTHPEAQADDFEKFLYTYGIPDPDLLIRTGGEMRLSNFLLWQMAYAEFYFCQQLWPEFSTDDLYAAFVAYQQRQRKYGRS